MKTQIYSKLHLSALTHGFRPSLKCLMSLVWGSFFVREDKVREIKCIAWNSETKKMVDLKKITPLALSGSMTDVDGIFIPFQKHLTLRLFTGLRDKNGKEIYDGDVVKVIHKHHRYPDDPNPIYVTAPGVVEFQSGGFWINGGGYSENCHFHYSDLDREIIGNIYENPELLK